MVLRQLVGVVFACASGFAHADLMNISSNGVHSISLQAGSCAIVGKYGSTYRGTKVLYIFAESFGNGINPKLTVQSLSRQMVVQNDDWRGTFYVNGVAQLPVSPSTYSAYLRLPNRSTDAAVVYFASVGEPICALTNEVASDGALYQVNISITDVTDAGVAAGERVGGAESMKTGGEALAEIDRLIDAYSAGTHR